MRRLFLEGLKDQAHLQQLPLDFPSHAYVKVGPPEWCHHTVAFMSCGLPAESADVSG